MDAEMHRNQAMYKHQCGRNPCPFFSFFFSLSLSSFFPFPQNQYFVFSFSSEETSEVSCTFSQLRKNNNPFSPPSSCFAILQLIHSNYLMFCKRSLLLFPFAFSLPSPSAFCACYARYNLRKQPTFRNASPGFLTE